MAKKNLKVTTGKEGLVVSVDADNTKPQNDFVVPIEDAPSTSEEDKARDAEDGLEYNEEDLAVGNNNAYETTNYRELKTVTGRKETLYGTIYVGVKR